MIGDLHCHSKFSDGSMSVKEILEYAERLNLDYLSITDHDTFSGADYAKLHNKNEKLKIIYGIEISTFDIDENKRVHILCYGAINTKPLCEIIDNTLKSRNKAALMMIEKVKAFYPVSINQIENIKGESKAIYKQHIMKSILDMGYTMEMYGDIYKKLFSQKDGKCYVLSKYPSTIDVLNSIKETGGIAVMAHPSEFKTEYLIDKYAELNLLDGIEVYHPSADENKSKELMQIAKKYNLLVTGGTDFHGFYSDNPMPLKSYTISDSHIEILLKKIAEKNSKYLSK